MDEFKYPEAIAEFDISIQINPKNWLAYYDRSICYGETNERQKAFDGYIKAYSLKKSAVTSNGLGIGHLGLNRFDEAKKYLINMQKGIIPSDYSYWHIFLFCMWMKTFNVEFE
jgi:tetratricopeptide (TPR) repeat protein